MMGMGQGTRNKKGKAPAKPNLSANYEVIKSAGREDNE